MVSREWPVMAGLGIFAVAAIGCAAYAVTVEPGASYALAGGLLVLAAGQLVAVVAATWRGALAEDRIRHDAQARRVLQDHVTAVSERLDAVSHRLDNPPRTPLDEIAAEVRALRDGVARMATAPVAETRAVPPQPAADASPSAQPDHLDLMLEPVIELSSGATAHYRAQLNLANPSGATIGHDELMHKADQGGMRDALDVHALRQVAPVLRKLRVRNPGMRVFLPLGAGTLASRAGTARLTEILAREHDVASGIVFEFRQDTLAALDSQGIANLAVISRHGVTMGLTNVAVVGLDLGALRSLGVKFLAINAAAFDSGLGVSSAWREFSQHARAMQFQIVAAKVAAAPQATAASQLARYASGPFFAPARKVKAEAGLAPAGQRARAA